MMLSRMAPFISSLWLLVATEAFVMPQSRSNPNALYGSVAEHKLSVLASADETSITDVGTTEEVRSVARERYTAFVGNIPFEMTSEALQELFSPYGKVELVSLPRQRETRQQRGFAFVDMSSREALDAAIAGIDGQTVGGRVLRVNESIPKDQLPSNNSNSNPRSSRKERSAAATTTAPESQLQDGYTKIYVGNIPFDCVNEDIAAFYAGYDISEIYIPMNGKTGRGRGFAFVTMKDADAQRAIADTNGVDFGGRTLVVSEPLPPGDKAPARTYPDRVKLYVGNLSFYTVRDTLVELFEEFGTVYDCYLPRDNETDSSRGFGFVTMSKDAAKRAVEELNGCEVDGRSIQVNEARGKKSSSADMYNNDD